MQKRDNEIDEASLSLMELRVDVKKTQEAMKERQQFLDDELNNNKEKEKKISMAERNAAKLRLEYQNIENARVQFQDEVGCLFVCLFLIIFLEFYILYWTFAINIALIKPKRNSFCLGLVGLCFFFELHGILLWKWF